MPTYDITIERPVYQTKVITIEADSVEDAMDIVNDEEYDDFSQASDWEDAEYGNSYIVETSEIEEV